MVYPRLQILVRSCYHSKLHPRQRYKFHCPSGDTLGLGVSMPPGQDEGHNSVAAGAHSEVTVDGISEVAHVGEILLPQQVTSSAVVQVPQLHLTDL